MLISEDYVFLKAEIIFQKNLSNDFSISISQDCKYIEINFDYFDLGEGIVMQVIHTGSKSDDIFLDGQIKSVRNIQRKYNYQPLLSSPLYEILQRTAEARFIFNWTSLLIGIFFIFFSIISAFTKVGPLILDSKLNWVLLFSFVLGLLYFYIGYNNLKSHIPKGFDIFNEDFLKEERQ